MEMKAVWLKKKGVNGRVEMRIKGLTQSSKEKRTQDIENLWFQEV